MQKNFTAPICPSLFFVLLVGFVHGQISVKKYQKIACGQDHSFVIKSDGTLWAWGVNGGFYGDGGTTSQLTPEQIGSDTKWLSIASSYHLHSTAIKSDGTLWAWGNNGTGSLGDGTTVSQYSPEQIGTDNKWVTIACGGYNTLAIKSDGTLWGWGVNNYGQLGDGTTSDVSSPEQIGSDNKWVSVACGEYHSTALKSDGTLWAWGSGQFGQLGDGANNISQTIPEQIGSDNKWVTIACGYYHTVAIKSDGTFWAWGYNGLDELGDGTTNSQNAPEQIGTDNKWINVSCGFYHNIAIKSDGTLWAWGENNNGQLGDGGTTDKNVPEQIGSDNHWLNVFGGGQYYSVALKSDGTLWTWGDNSNSQLGDGTTTNKNIPEQITTVGKLPYLIAAGGLHSLAIHADGTLWTWGGNNHGQLADGTTTDKYTGEQIGSDTKWISVAGGHFHTLALKSDGTIWSCGDNSVGSTGDGTNIEKHSLVQTGTDNNWIAINCSEYHSFALKSDGTLWGWGENEGELGDGTTINRYAPQQVGTDNHWKKISSGQEHAVAIKSDGTLWAWGVNTDGQLGDGSTTDDYIPEQIGTDKTWVSLACGDYHTLALKSDGTLWAWGYNFSGQLGDGTTSNNHAPEQIGTDNNWVSIASGQHQSIAIKSDGTVWAWGLNSSGELGDGTTTDKHSPEQIGSVNDWIKLAGGGDPFTIALHSTGVLCATGSNSNGQLGNGTTSGSTSFDCSAGSIILPVTFLSFNGQIINSNALLNWETNNEVNTSQFIVERSTDGRAYQAVENIAAQNSAGVHFYNFTDYNVNTLGVNIVYYRLKQTDIDGRLTYSPIIALIIKQAKPVAWLYPNPAKEKTTLMISTSKNEDLIYIIVDQNGRTIQRKEITITQGTNQIIISMASLAAGQYTLLLSGAEISQQLKFIKQ